MVGLVAEIKIKEPIHRVLEDVIMRRLVGVERLTSDQREAVDIGLITAEEVDLASPECGQIVGPHATMFGAPLDRLIRLQATDLGRAVFSGRYTE